MCASLRGRVGGHRTDEPARGRISSRITTRQVRIAGFQFDCVVKHLLVSSRQKKHLPVSSSNNLASGIWVLLLLMYAYAPIEIGVSSTV